MPPGPWGAGGRALGRNEAAFPPGSVAGDPTFRTREPPRPRAPPSLPSSRSTSRWRPSRPPGLHPPWTSTSRRYVCPGRPRSSPAGCTSLRPLPGLPAGSPAPPGAPAPCSDGTRSPGPSSPRAAHAPPCADSRVSRLDCRPRGRTRTHSVPGEEVPRPGRAWDPPGGCGPRGVPEAHARGGAGRGGASRHSAPPTALLEAGFAAPAGRGRACALGEGGARARWGRRRGCGVWAALGRLTPGG